MRISEAFCKMRLSEYCTSADVDRAIAVTVESFVGGQKVSCKKALSRAFAKYVAPSLPWLRLVIGPLLTSWHRYTLTKPQSQRSQGRGPRTGPHARQTAVMA